MASDECINAGPPGENAGQDSGSILRLLHGHRSWTTDETGGAHVPPGWVGPVAEMFTEVGQSLGGLAVQVRPRRIRPVPERHFEAVPHVVRDARPASSTTCPCCGGVDTPRRPGGVRSLCDHGVDVGGAHAVPEGFFDPTSGDAVLGRLIATNVRGIRSDDVVVTTVPRRRMVRSIGERRP